MNLDFTDEDMLRPIFVDPPDGIGRPDAWTAPHGFMIGGMGDMQKSEIAQQYFNAANELVKLIWKQQVEDFILAFPILYLYRHSIELMLKAAMNQGDGHELDKLAELFVNSIASKHKQQVPKWIVDRLKEIATIDPRSTSFRYSVKSRKGKHEEALGGEHYIDLRHLQRAMRALYLSLERVINFDNGLPERRF